jgi:bacillaene synthase trans-acting acyltransferase
MPRTIVMFPGQGSQYYQMGRELYLSDPAFRAAMDRCDAICRGFGAPEPSSVIYARPLAESDMFDRLSESNAALLAIGWSLAQALFARGIEPDMLLGYSLGETIAAVVSGALSLEDGFRLVLAQAHLFESEAPEGGMLAVLGDPAPLAADPSLARGCEVAGLNAPLHRVLSGLAADLAAARPRLEAAGLTVARLPIRYPFHSAAIEPLRPALHRLIDGFDFTPPRIPVFSTASGDLVERFDAAHFWNVVRGQTRFRVAIERLANEGPWQLIEAGPSGTLTSFARQIAAPGVTALRAIDQFGQNVRTMEQLMAAIA